MEADILKSLNFDLGNPTIKTILRYGVRQCLHTIFSSWKLLVQCTYYAEFDNTLDSFMFLLIWVCRRFNRVAEESNKVS